MKCKTCSTMELNKNSTELKIIGDLKKKKNNCIISNGLKMTFSCEVVCPLMRCRLYLKKLISLDQDGSNMITWFALHISFNEEILSLQFHSEAAETFTRSSLTV